MSLIPVISLWQPWATAHRPARAERKGEGVNELAIFAGAGGGILGGQLCGFRTVCAVEINAYAASVLLSRQNDGCLAPFPIWDDVRTFDGIPWRGAVDVVSGGFPCQDIALPGRGAGIEGAKSGLWKEMARIIGEVRPSFVIVENSPAIRGRGLSVVLGDLASLGFDARWRNISASMVGAPHERNRWWLVANSRGIMPIGLQMRDTSRGAAQGEAEPLLFPAWSERPSALSDLPRVDDGMAERLDAVEAIGNGQVPAVVRLAWETLKP